REVRVTDVGRGHCLGPGRGRGQVAAARAAAEGDGTDVAVAVVDVDGARGHAGARGDRGDGDLYRVGLAHDRGVGVVRGDRRRRRGLVDRVGLGVSRAREVRVTDVGRGHCLGPGRGRGQVAAARAAAEGDGTDVAVAVVDVDGARG